MNSAAKPRQVQLHAVGCVRSISCGRTATRPQRTGSSALSPRSGPRVHVTFRRQAPPRFGSPPWLFGSFLVPAPLKAPGNGASHPSPRQRRLDLAEMMTRLLHYRSSVHSFSVGPDQSALRSATVSRLLLPLQSFGGIVGPCTVSGRRRARVPLVYLRLRWRSVMGEPPSVTT